MILHTDSEGSDQTLKVQTDLSLGLADMPNVYLSLCSGSFVHLLLV